MCVSLSWFGAGCSAWRVAVVSIAASLSPETPRASCMCADDDRCARSDGGCPCRSQPRRGPGEPGPSPAPGRLGAGWARRFFFDFARAALEESPFAGPGNSPTAWPCSCLLAAAAAVGISAHATAVVAPSAVGASPCSPVAADTTAASAAGVTGAKDVDSATSAICSGSAPNLVPSASTCATRGMERVKLSRRQRQRQKRQQTPRQQPSPLQAQQHQQPQTSSPPSSSFWVAQQQPAQSPLHRFPLPLRPQHQWGPVTPPTPPPPPAVVPSEPPTLVEQRVMHVGTCLTLLSYVLDQLHVTLLQQEVQIEAMQPAALSAAEEMQHYLPLIGFVPGSPGDALAPGPGALARLAESAQDDPLNLVAAAASVLRWLDGRLCWILVEYEMPSPCQPAVPACCTAPCYSPCSLGPCHTRSARAAGFGE
ncbi:unnamed protein product [Closterium sp. NIES-64]|nr:unnamed protein product [Closterium sp. NIES-64]